MPVPGDSTWTPDYTGFAVGEIIGGSGDGREGVNSGVGGAQGGGGGGAYARKVFAVTNGVGVNVRVGGAPGGGLPRESLIINSSVCAADYGESSAFNDPGAPGGQAAASTGDVVYSGGDGCPAPGGNAAGGGGGSSATRNSPGVDGIQPAGGTVAPYGGNGGNGGPAEGPGVDGQQPGGGAGGGGADDVSPGGGTLGGHGQIGCAVIWNLTDWPDAATPGTSPVRGASPIVTYGDVPLGWLDTGGNPKAAKRAFMM